MPRRGAANRCLLDDLPPDASTTVAPGAHLRKNDERNYRIPSSHPVNGEVIELQADDADLLRKALECGQKSVEVSLPGAGDNKVTIYTEHIVSIEASGLIRRGNRVCQRR
jgi:hypothetical protein